jgi:hypothetical protein
VQESLVARIALALDLSIANSIQPLRLISTMGLIVGFANLFYIAYIV